MDLDLRRVKPAEMRATYEGIFGPAPEGMAPSAMRAEILRRAYDPDYAADLDIPLPPCHPAANLLPLMPLAELREFAAGILADGLREPTAWFRGELLDGRNRWRACRLNGMEQHEIPRIDLPDDIDPVVYVKVHNVDRRHLTTSQKSTVAGKLVLMMREARAAANLPPPPHGRDRDEAAKKFAIAPRTVGHALRVLRDGAPELVAKVESGAVRVSVAADLSSRPIEEQRAILASADPRLVAKVAKEQRAAKTTQRREEKTAHLATVARGNGPLLTVTHYPVIYADPPWKYDDGTTDPSRTIDNQYQPMDLDAIKALPVGELATSAAILFMWAVNPLLPEALEVIRAWGFTYKTNRAWDKQVKGMGYWVLGEHELLLIATRGDMPTPPESARPGSMIRARRSGTHSEKPAEAAEGIERMFPSLPRIELFCRSPRPGWAHWGNEAGAKLVTG